MLKRRLKARELVTVASLIAIAVASRAAFYELPQVKPMCAIVIIASMVFGPTIGFTTGALSMLLSNFIFGQGMWTPFQMLGMGMCGLICGFVFKNKRIAKNRIAVAVIGFAVCFAVYGIIVDTSSVIMMASEFNIKIILSIYASGVPFNAIHAASTFAVLLFAAPVFCRVLERIKIKYDLFGGAEE